MRHRFGFQDDRLLDGSYSSFGSIYMDYRSDKGFSDRNTVIYGHHMNDESMFGGLKNWKDQAYYEKHPVIMLYTPEKNYEIQLFSGYTTTAVEGMRNDFADDEDFDAYYVNKLKKHSTFQSNVTMTANDRMVALYTCAYDFKDARYVLYGKLVELD